MTSRLLAAAFSLTALTLAQQVNSREVPVATNASDRGRVDSPIPFAAVGARWIAAGDPHLQVRATTDGVIWTEWRDLELQPDGPLDRTSSGLQFFDWDSRAIEYRRTDPSALLLDLRFVFIDPGRTPPDQLKRTRKTPMATGVARDARAIPEFATRTAWGCPDGQNTRGIPAFTTVTHLIVHHSADGFTGSDYPAWMRAIWQFHVFSNGWSDFGYNWAIDPQGNLYEGRGGGDNVLGAHFSCVNTGTMGVVMLGTFTSRVPTEAALATLTELLAWKAAQRGIDPLGKSVHRGTNAALDNISGHRDGNRQPNSCTVTECPGNAFYPLLPTVRLRVAEALTQPQPALRATFDRDLAGWTATGLWRSWDGMAWYGDETTRTYDTGTRNFGELVSPAIQLDADATLRFRSRHDTEDEFTFWDQKWVEVQVDGGDWVAIDQIVTQSREWVDRSYPLKLRGSVRVRFRFDSVDDWKNSYEGWFLDDVVITVP